MPSEAPLALQPMEAAPVGNLPAGKAWLLEPKYDGFRCILFRYDDAVNLQIASAASARALLPEGH
jgi:ATP-dependent DNA ligase